MVKQILIADDDAEDVEGILRVLKKAGRANPVVAVTDGEETLAYFKGAGPFADREKFPLPSVLFLDLKMHRRNGLEVLEWLRRTPHLTNMLIVALSGRDNPKDFSRACELGAHTFLTKPIRPEDIARLTKTFHRYWA